MQASSVRPPAVAGMFYPGTPGELTRVVDGYLAEASAVADESAPAPKAIIVPHAGYVYSGSTAARGFARLLPVADRITRVVLLGPTHRFAVDGLALPRATAFRTPLGDVPLARTDLSGLSQVVTSAAAHAREHSLEVEVPFLQRVLGEFELVAFAVGRVDGPSVAEVLDRVWGGPETVIVVSSDLSHYHPYAVARRLDRETVTELLALRGPIDPRRACGAYGLNGLVVSAARRGLTTELLGLCNSGDTAGDKEKVVGYAAIGLGG